MSDLEAFAKKHQEQFQSAIVRCAEQHYIAECRWWVPVQVGADQQPPRRTAYEVHGACILKATLGNGVRDNRQQLFRRYSPLRLVMKEIIVLSLWSSIAGSGRVVFPTPRTDRALVEFLRDRIEANDLRAVVDRTYSLEDIADAYRYVETQQKIGIVVISVAPGPSKSYAIQPS